MIGCPDVQEYVALSHAVHEDFLEFCMTSCSTDVLGDKRVAAMHHERKCRPTCQVKSSQVKFIDNFAAKVAG